MFSFIVARRIEHRSDMRKGATKNLQKFATRKLASVHGDTLRA